jgi:hypothetical protein
VSDTKSVIRTFVTAWEGRQTILLSDRGHTIPTAGENLVWVGLMADVPNQSILWGVEYVVQGYRKVYGSKTGCEMSAGLTDAMQQVFPEFSGQSRELIFRKRAKVSRIADGVQEWGLVVKGHGKISPAGRAKAQCSSKVFLPLGLAVQRQEDMIN